MPKIAKMKLLDVNIQPWTIKKVLKKISKPHPRALKISYLNIHTIMLASKNRQLKDFFNDTENIIFCDGVGVFWAIQFLYQKVFTHRMTPPDFIGDFLETCTQKQWSVFFLGDREGVLKKALKNISKNHPRLQISGHQNGFVSIKKMLKAISQNSPDIVLIGLGSPIQEKIADKISVLYPKIKVCFCVGALFRHFAYPYLRGPRCLTSNGLEWLWRSLLNPALFFSRYLPEIPRFYAKILWEKIRKK